MSEYVEIDGKKYEIKKPKRKHLVKLLDAVDKLGKGEYNITDYMEKQSEIIEELTGISKDKQNEMDLSDIAKVTEMVLGEVISVMGFQKLLKMQQSGLQGEKVL